MGSEERPVITPRQAEVLALVAQGMTTREIARRLKIAPTTVSSHVRAMMTEVCAPTRSALVIRLLR